MAFSIKYIKICLFGLCVSLTTCTDNIDIQEDYTWEEKAMSSIHEQLLMAVDEYNPMFPPRSVLSSGSVRNSNKEDWTCGFFSGTLWFAYELTNDTILFNSAIKFTNGVRDAKYRKDSHDIGFIINCSVGNALRLTKDQEYYNDMIIAAENLALRYDTRVGCIKSWDWSGWEFPVIIDNIMNLELLFRTAKITDNSLLRDIAISHADKTLLNHFRSDNSCFHLVNYDLKGNVLSKETHQGFDNYSSWTRGQAWALYGYTMCYRETKEDRYLNHAIKIAHYILNHPTLQKNKIPCWDLSVPHPNEELKDASAAAIIASALLEISSVCDDPKKSSSFFFFAEDILKTLSSNNYLNKPGTNGFFILNHSVGNYVKSEEVDVPIIYADYY